MLDLQELKKIDFTQRRQKPERPGMKHLKVTHVRLPLDETWSELRQK